MKDINVLLLGESGSGKTTFINALLNYFLYENFENARQSGAVVAAPMLIPFKDTDGKMRCFKVEPNIGEEEKNKDIQEYFLNFKEHRIRFIDSPGFEESGSEEFGTIFKRIAHLRELHAVCFFIKSTVSRKNTLFEYCIRQTLSELDLPIVKNIIFVLTHGRSVQFNPSVAKTVLAGFVASIKNKRPFVEIPLHDNNVFCVESESVINLIATVYGKKPQSESIQNWTHIWNFSAEECKRLISEIQRIVPYKFLDGNTVTELHTFFAERTTELLEAFEINYHNSENCKKLKRNSEAACRLMEDVQRQMKSSVSLAQPSKESFLATATTTPYIASRKTIGQNTSREMQTSSSLSDCYTDDDSGNHKIKSSHVDRQEKDKLIQHLRPPSMSKSYTNSAGITIPKTTASSTSTDNVKYADVQHVRRQVSNEGTSASSTTDSDVQEKVNKIAQVLINQDKLVSKLYEVVKQQTSEVHKVLKEMAEFSLFLENNGTNEDVFRKHMNNLFSSLTSENRNLEGAKLVQNLMGEYNKLKAEVSRNPTLDVTEENIQKLIKRFEKLQIQMDISKHILSN